MKKIAPLTALFVLLGTGCSHLIPGTTTPPVAGNWGFEATSSVATNHNLTAINGQITNAGKLAAGIFVASGACFLALPNAIPTSGTVPVLTMTGSIDGDTLQLTSAQFSSQTVTIRGTVSADGRAFTGTYSVAGGCDDKDTGSLVGHHYPSLTGTFAGSAVLNTLSPVQAQSISISTILTQSAIPDGFAAGLSGTITITGSACFKSGTATAPTIAAPTGVGGLVYGPHYSLLYNMDDGSQMIALGTMDLPGTTLTNSFAVSGGKCNGAFSVLAPLTRQ